MAVDGNVYDEHTLNPHLMQVKELTKGKIKKAIINRGYRIKGKIGYIDVAMPKILKKESYYLKKQLEARCRSHVL